MNKMIIYEDIKIYLDGSIEIINEKIKKIRNEMR